MSTNTRKTSFRRPWTKRAVMLCLVFFSFLWINNTSTFTTPAERGPKVLAHRGLAQTFDIEGLKWDTNTAQIIHNPEHPYLENTLPSIKAAFDRGADMVEFDVRLTKDKKLAVFHDFLLDYRTDGKDKVSDSLMAGLRKLDVGYGYTSDAGRSFPFRGKGFGLLVSIEEVLKAFPDRSFLIHVKDGGALAGRLLVEIFKGLESEALQDFGVYGDHKAITEVHNHFPEIKVLSLKTLKNALISYILVGWTGYIPEAIRESQVHAPLKYARFLWGWPTKFLNRMKSVNTRFILVNGSGKWSEGFDNETELKMIPKDFTGYIWTNRIDKVAPIILAERALAKR